MTNHKGEIDAYCDLENDADEKRRFLAQFGVPEHAQWSELRDTGMKEEGFEIQSWLI